VRLFVAELRKLVTLPSLRLTAALTVAATALLTALDLPPSEPIRYTQAGFVVLGVLAATSEHQGGDQFRTTLLAMPRRLPLFAAKVLSLAACCVPLAVLAGAPDEIPFAVVYLTLTALFAAAVGGLVRHAEVAAVLLLTGYFVVGPLLPAGVAAYLPGTAGLDPSRGAGATAVWTACALALAAVAFHRRDA
jgi:ABC-2 type transport system permease protein